MQFDIVTIFPGFFQGILENGIVRRAVAEDRLQVRMHDLREFTHDRHRTVDDRPFGGGEGMVLKVEPLAEALASLGIKPKAERGAEDAGTQVVLLSAMGRRFTQATARQMVEFDRVVLICGRYEGVDERITELYCDRELSIGDYVLSGGELGAAVIVDAVMRLLPGVLGNEASSEFESFGQSDDAIATDVEGVPRSQHGAGGLLDYPHFTRPAEFCGLKAPEVLLNGDHSQIRKWRRREQLRKTLQNRPDLLENAQLSKADRHTLAELRNLASPPESD
jgi:tRNA (guanine37-N1)-methyltransferase